MLKRYKTIYLAMMIPSVIIFCISVISSILMEEFKSEITEWFGISIITIVISAATIVFIPQIIQERLVKKLFFDSDKIKVRIDLDKLRKRGKSFSVTERKIFAMAIKSNNCYLHRYNPRDYIYQLEIICQDDGEFDYCNIYDSFRDFNCLWLCKYSKYLEVVS